MKRDELSLVTMDGREAALLLAYPCPCESAKCVSLGQHVWEAAHDMTPGLKAQTTDPRVSGQGSQPDDDDTAADPGPRTPELVEFLGNVTAYWRAARKVAGSIAKLRPDRHIPLREPLTDDMWCANHLHLIGVCEPRFRGELCRQCYHLQLAHSAPPDAQLLRAIRDVGRITPAALAEFLTRTRPSEARRNKAKRKKAG